MNPSLATTSFLRMFDELLPNTESATPFRGWLLLRTLMLTLELL